MVNEPSIGEVLTRWCAKQGHVKALILIGSRARRTAATADEHSDWDFHLVTTRPALWLQSSGWLSDAGLEPQHFCARLGRLGSATKVTAIVRGKVLDVVILPRWKLEVAQWALRLRLVHRLGGLAHALRGLSSVANDGFQVLLGGSKWVAFYRRVAREIAPLALADAEVCVLADAFVCDYVFARQKLDRGELAAVQRWLHLHVAEANYQLLHELLRRQQKPSMPDARRLEQFADADMLRRMSVNSAPSVDALRAALEQAAATLRLLTHQLVGDQWHWPEL